MRRLLIILSAVLVVSCKPSTLAFEDTVYVNSFDDFYAQKCEEIDLGVIGITDIRIFDKYLIVGTQDPDGYVKIFNKASRSLLGSFFRKGNGPSELLYPTPVSPFVFGHDSEGKVYAEFDNQAGTVIRFDITESISEGKTISEPIGKIDGTTFSFIDLKDGSFFYKKLSEDRNAQIRSIVDKDGETVPANMKVLNAATLSNGKDVDGTRFNVLSSIIRYDRKSQRFLEASTELNTVHMYSRDGSFARTFCLGDKLDDFEQLAVSERAERPMTSTCVRQFDDFAIVMYIGKSEKDFVLKHDDITPSLVFFYWDGSTGTRMTLPHPATDFDIDLETMYIYAHDSVTDKLYLYDTSGM